MTHALASHTRVPVEVRRRVRAHRIDVARMTRYRGGTYSHTVDTITFIDGSTARTDLIRLHPGIDAYSLDFAGQAPTQPSRYQPATWSAVPNMRARAYEPEVDWIVRNSFPTLGTAELSRRLRAAGHPLGAANLAEHEAIAATQAAIWHFTNGLNLDNRPLNVPVTVEHTTEGIVFEFDDEPQLGGYTVELTSASAVSLLLQKSHDGIQWRDVAASGLNVGAGQRTYSKTLGVGSTTSSSRHGHPGRGYRLYRLKLIADRVADVVLRDVGFWLTGSGHYRNVDRVVHLYNYLLAGAHLARSQAVEVRLVPGRATFEDGLVGPLRLQATHSAVLTASHGSILGADGARGVIEPGAEFYVKPHPGASRVTVTASVPGTPEGFGGRVITGVAQGDENSRLTPVALAVPAQVVVDFEIAWQIAAGAIAA